MNYRSIMVCLDDHPASALRQALTVRLALSHGAYLGGMHFSNAPNAGYLEAFGPGQLSAADAETIAEHQHLAHQAFREAVREAALLFDWITYTERDIAMACSRARTADLIVIGQEHGAGDDKPAGLLHLEKLLLDSGRPVLMVPDSPGLEVDPRRVMITWNDSRESARAISDALPLLRRAEHIDLMTVLTAGHPEAGLKSAERVVSWLARHGVIAHLVVNESALDVAEWLLARADDSELGCDLIVAGAYSHNPTREMLLGGVTRTLLRESRVPVLFSH
jgi:nucleotide-binding universal stress UspA family protein